MSLRACVGLGLCEVTEPTRDQMESGRRAGSEMTNVRVLVQGASIAGPALAHWLHRHGAAVTVVEQTSGLRPGGQAVDARGVAKEVIRRMGLESAVRAACTDTAGAYMVERTGTSWRPTAPTTT